MRDILPAKFPNSFLFLLGCCLTLCSITIANAQLPSASINLEATEWQGKSISQVNLDGSLTVLSLAYNFEDKGKVTLTILISKGVGVATTGTPFGNIPYATASRLVGTYKINGKSIYMDFPDRAIEATLSGNRMKGVLTAKKNNQKEEWLIEKFIPENKSSNSARNSEQRNYNSSSSSSNKYSAPIDSPIIGTWKYQDGCTTTGFGTFTATSCDRTSTYIYSQDGNVQSIHIVKFSLQSTTGNWKYTAENELSGILEEFKGDKLVEKGNIKFLGKSQLQYTITFSVSSDIVGKTYIWNKQ